MTVPQIATVLAGPAVTHSNDSSLVTTTTPAVPGEVLSLRATGLEPTVPRIDPGHFYRPIHSPAQLDELKSVAISSMKRIFQLVLAFALYAGLSAFAQREIPPLDT